MTDWSEESTIRLIEQFKAHPVLWDPRHNGFKDDLKRKGAWTNISFVMKSDKAEVEHKMRSLLFEYNRERKKLTELKVGDVSDSIKPIKRWYAMNTMSFLSNVTRTILPSIGMEKKLRADPKESKTQNARRKIVPRQVTRRDSAIIKRFSISNKQSSFMNRRIVTKRQSEIATLSATPMVPNKPSSNAGTLTRLIKRKHDNAENDCHQTTMKTAQQKKTPNMRDEYQIFGEHVACKLRKLPTKYCKNTVEHHINNIIHQAELGQFNHPPVSRNIFSSNRNGQIKSISLQSASFASKEKSGVDSLKASRIALDAGRAIAGINGTMATRI